MGLIKKKTAVRGTEGGIKYICDVCSADITSTVRIRCAHSVCKDYDLCVPCFSEGKSSREHDPPTHTFNVIEQHSIPIFADDWGADEESLLLEGAGTYGLGSWADIADHIGGFRDKDEVRDHYISTYVHSSRFPLPEYCSPQDTQMTKDNPRDQFLSRKKRRIEERKTANQNATPSAPKQKPTSSVPSCHEVQGFMPGRLEFETEFYNEAEEAVQHMQFDPGEGEGPERADGQPDELKLKLTVMEIYNNKLTARVERKKMIFEHQLLEYRRNMNIDKRRTKEERDLYMKTKSFARVMPRRDFDEFAKDIEYELNLRQAIAQLQDWRQMQIGDLKSGEKYELEKAQRAARAQQLGSFDRNFGSSRMSNKPPPIPETPSAVNTLTATDLVLKPPEGLADPGQTTVPQAQAGSDDKKPSSTTIAPTNESATMTANSSSSNATSIVFSKPKFSVPPLNNITPLKFEEQNYTPDLHLLTVEEREVCSILRIMPKPYTVMKEGVLKEAIKQGGTLKKKTVRDICRIDSTKGGKLFDFWTSVGYLQKA